MGNIIYLRLITKTIYDSAFKKALMIIEVILAIITVAFVLLSIESHPTLAIILGVLYVLFSIIYHRRQDLKDKTSKNEGVFKSNSHIPSIKHEILSIIDRLFLTKFAKPPILELGDSGTFFHWKGAVEGPMFTIFGDSCIKISKERGVLKISTKITGRDGLVAEIENNEWKVNPQELFDRNYNKTALEVRDKDGDIVLQTRLFNDRIQFQGKFYDRNGNGVAIGGRKDMGGGIIERTGLAHPSLEYVIEPIFKYPSSLHFGCLK